jgi:hypothetical protein
MIGWYFDVVIGYLIRAVIRVVKTRRSNAWPVNKATVANSGCPAFSYGGPVAEVGYTYIYEGDYYAGVHREPFLLHGSAKEYAARFSTGSGIIIRVKPGQPETSLICDEDQTLGARILGGPKNV